MIVQAHLYDTKTGKRVVNETDFEDAHAAWFMWVEGNYSCDCNRSIFMYGWGNAVKEDVPVEDMVPFPCSEDRIVLEKLVIKETGDEIEL